LSGLRLSGVMAAGARFRLEFWRGRSVAFHLAKPFFRTVIVRASVASLLTTVWTAVAFAQDATAAPNVCNVDPQLKPIKTVVGQYSEEATKNGVEGRVVVCVTVNAEGKVAGVRPVSGPSELIQPTIDAVKQFRFEPPTNAPAMTLVETSYSLTKPCPGGGKGMDSGEVKVHIGPGHIADGERGEPLKIIANVSQPQPPYPERARAERRRGRLYLSIYVNGNGDVVDAKIVLPLDESLDKPALDTLRTWKFKVSPPDGKTTVFWVTLTFQIPCLDKPENK
jgi:TonB family protein